MNNAKVIGILGLCLLFSCNALKRVAPEEELLAGNKVQVDGERINLPDIQGLMVQKPNSSILGYPFKLNLYNLAKPHPDSSYQNWLDSKPNRRKRLTRWLSEKQVQRLGHSFIVEGYNNFFKKVGEAPVIIDTNSTIKSLERLKAYYADRGYFNAQGNFSIDSTNRKQRSNVTYDLTLGPAYIIGSYEPIIASTAIDSIYQLNKNESLIRKGDQFNYNNFKEERERLTKIFRNTGIHNFQESSIRFPTKLDTIAAHKDSMLDVKLVISNRTVNDREAEYKVSRLRNINIYPDFDQSTDMDSLKLMRYEDYNIFYGPKLDYLPVALTNAIFFEKNKIYSDQDYVRTNRQIANLNTFKFPNIQFVQDSIGNDLDANIFLSPRPKYSLDTSIELSRSNIQIAGLGFGLSVIDRNIFGGAENLSIATRVAYGILGNTNGNQDFTSELGGDINLSFPRIWAPFNTNKWIPYEMIPQTRLTLGTNFQKNIGLDRQSLNAVLRYTWTPDNFRNHALELINIEFVRNTNPDAFFSQYQNTYSILNNIAKQGDIPEQPGLEQAYDDNGNLVIPTGTAEFLELSSNPGFPIESADLRTVQNIAERKDRLTTNNLIFTTNYSYSKNNRENVNDDSFYQYRFKLESAGNLLSLINNVFPFNNNDNNEQLIFNIPYSQYIKGEIDFIKHWRLSKNQVLAFRSFVGMAIPYGNANNIPFVRSYFAGGSNDNRAWNVYSLGPGSTQSTNDFNEANFKLGLNAEYRFPILGALNGALFADAGNIWNLNDNVDDPEATFNGFSSLQDIALGTGLGFRYDLSYFIVRVDVGFKTHNPALRGSDRWFSNYNLNEAVFQIGINYPF